MLTNQTCNTKNKKHAKYTTINNILAFGNHENLPFVV